MTLLLRAGLLILMVVMGEGIEQRGGNFKTTVSLYDLHGPERLCDTPICERGFVGLACGAGMTGTRPVIDFMFADFVLDAIGEIINQIAKTTPCGRFCVAGFVRLRTGVEWAQKDAKSAAVSAALIY